MSNIKDLREDFSSEDEDSILEYYNGKNYKCKKIEKQSHQARIILPHQSPTNPKFRIKK